MNDWSIVLLDLDTSIDLCLYISSHVFFFQKELFKCHSPKRIKSWKILASKTSLTRKRWSKYVLKCMMPKPKAQLPKFHKKKISWHRFSYQKYDKWKPNEKLPINCKHMSEGSYMFISTNEIGHLTLYELCMTWLNWSLKLHTRL